MSSVIIAAQSQEHLKELFPRVRDFVQRFRSDVKVLVVGSVDEGQEISLAQSLPGAQSISIQEVEDLAQSLSEFTENVQVDLICLPNNKEATGSRGFLKSSIAESLLRKGSSLLFACCEYKGEYENLLAPVDMGITSRNAVDTASRYFPLSKIDLLYVFKRHSDGMITNPTSRGDTIPEVRNSSVSDLKGQLSLFAQSMHMPDVVERRVVVEGDPLTMTLEETEKGNHQLIILGYKKRNVVAKLFSDSLVSQLVKGSPSDIFLCAIPDSSD